MFIHYFDGERKVSRVLATGSECLSWVIRQNVIGQVATSSESLVASTQFLVALATSESQFQALQGDDFRSLSKPDAYLDDE